MEQEVFQLYWHSGVGQIVEIVGCGCSRLDTADFATLFTHLPHSDSFGALKRPFRLFFREARRPYLVVKKDRVWFSSNCSPVMY